ncbi:uncharacterized protein METZ01_LOCUS357555, partial [marine metagenome]
VTGENSFKKYDRVGAYHYELMESDPLYAAKINKALSMVNPGAIVCDIGCGDGVFLKYAKEIGAFIAGMDTSKEGIELARKFSGCEALCVGSANYLPLRASSVDLIVMIDVVNYFDDYAGAIREVSRALKKKGNLIIMSPPDVDIKKEKKTIPDSWQKQVCSIEGLRPVLEESLKVSEVTFIRKPVPTNLLQIVIYFLRVSGVLSLLRRIILRKPSGAKSDREVETSHVKESVDINLDYYNLPKSFIKKYEPLEYIIVAQKV